MSLPDDAAAYNAGDELLLAAARRAGGRAIRCAGRDVAGSALTALALGFQAKLESSSLSRGDRVLVLARDTPAFVAAFTGAMRGGFVPVPISTLLPPADVAFIARDAGVRAAVVDGGLADSLRDPALYPRGAELVAADAWGFAGVAPGAEPGRGADARGRARLLSLHLRHHGRAEGRGAPARGPRGHRRPLRARRARDRTRRPAAVGREALLRVRARELTHVSAVARRRSRARAGARHARRRCSR